MLIIPLKTALTQAVRAGFNSQFPDADLQNLSATIDYPETKEQYPGIWVDFEPVGNITRGGIDQPFAAYYTTDGSDVPIALSRWRAQGYATFTIGALSMTQRDRIFDHMVGMVAFSKMVPYVGFRGYIEHFPEIAIEMNADTISVRGTSERPQPDWGTADVVYETTMAIELYCEFAAPQATIAPGVLGGIDVITEAPGPVFGADVT